MTVCLCQCANEGNIRQCKMAGCVLKREALSQLAHLGEQKEWKTQKEITSQQWGGRFFAIKKKETEETQGGRSWFNLPTHRQTWHQETEETTTGECGSVGDLEQNWMNNSPSSGRGRKAKELVVEERQVEIRQVLFSTTVAVTHWKCG